MSLTLTAEPTPLASGYSIVCRSCGQNTGDEVYRADCPACGGVLDFKYTATRQDGVTNSLPPESMWRYRPWLPLRCEKHVLSLAEGWTPLLKARVGRPMRLYLKNETVNPTGSHKDRNLSLGISKALECGFETVLLYSDGSTSLSSAAYAARGGLRHVTVVARDTPESRLLPLVIYNSMIVVHQGRSNDALEWAHQACTELGLYETSTYRAANPYQAEAPKTIAFEIWDQLGEVPDWIVVPVGGGGTLAGIWQGFRELRDHAIIRRMPRVAGILPQGHNLLESAHVQGVTDSEQLRVLAPVELPATDQVKLAMNFPPDGIDVIEAIKESDGVYLYASDQEAYAAQRRLGADEGLYVEVSAATVLAGVDKLLERGLVHKDQTVVALVTGSGFRETSQLLRVARTSPIVVQSSADIAVLEKQLQRFAANESGSDGSDSR